MTQGDTRHMKQEDLRQSDGNHCPTASNTWNTYWRDTSTHEWWTKPATEVLTLIDSLSPSSSPVVLDLGCGLGRHAIAFAQAGFRTTATDVSETAIASVRKQAEELRLAIDTRICDVLGGDFDSKSFDVVVSYNVIYHGYRQQFAAAIKHVRQLLRPDGVFFFTCPSRDDGKYGHGDEVAPHTFLCTNSITPGDMHYFADREDLEEMLTAFGSASVAKNEGYWDNRGTQQFYSNWLITARKP